MKAKECILLSFFFLGGDVIIAMFANLGVLTYAFQWIPRRIDFILLGTTVLGIYILDRSYDSMKEPEIERTVRGQFYENKTKYLIPAGFAILLFSFVLALISYELKFLLGGIAIGVSVSIYLLFHYFFKGLLFPKEVLIAFLYTIAVSYPIYFFRPIVNETEVLVYLLFFLSILSEVLLLSIEDIEWDIKHEQPTITSWLGKNKTKHVIKFLLIVGFLLSLLLAFSGDRLLKVGIGYTIYFLLLGQIPKIFSCVSLAVRKVTLELSYLPFLIYYFL